MRDTITAGRSLGPAEQRMVAGGLMEPCGCKTDYLCDIMGYDEGTGMFSLRTVIVSDYDVQRARIRASGGNPDSGVTCTAVSDLLPPS